MHFQCPFSPRVLRTSYRRSLRCAVIGHPLLSEVPFPGRFFSLLVSPFCPNTRRSFEDRGFPLTPSNGLPWFLYRAVGSVSSRIPDARLILLFTSYGSRSPVHPSCSYIRVNSSHVSPPVSLLRLFSLLRRPGSTTRSRYKGTHAA